MSAPAPVMSAPGPAMVPPATAHFQPGTSVAMPGMLQQQAMVSPPQAPMYQHNLMYQQGPMIPYQPAQSYQGYQQNRMQTSMMPHPAWAQYVSQPSTSAALGCAASTSAAAHPSSPWHFRAGDSTVQAAKCAANIVYEPALDQCATCLGFFMELRMFEPCGHMPFCSECLRKIARKKNNRVWCPNCNMHQTRTTEIVKMLPRK